MRKLLLSDRNLQQVDLYSVVGLICSNCTFISLWDEWSWSSVGTNTGKQLGVVGMLHTGKNVFRFHVDMSPAALDVLRNFTFGG